MKLTDKMLVQQGMKILGMVDRRMPKDYVKCPWCKDKIHTHQIFNNLCPNCRGQIREVKK